MYFCISFCGRLIWLKQTPKLSLPQHDCRLKSASIQTIGVLVHCARHTSNTSEATKSPSWLWFFFILGNSANRLTTIDTRNVMIPFFLCFLWIWKWYILWFWSDWSYWVIKYSKTNLKTFQSKITVNLKRLRIFLFISREHNLLSNMKICK